MATLNEMRRYQNYEFSSGPRAGADYIQFQNKYINHLRSICRANGWVLVNVGRNHYCFSTFIRDGNRYVYLSISDVRYFPNQWYNHILIRNAKNEKDYHGGQNRYCTLEGLTEAIKKCLEVWDYESQYRV